MDLFFVDDPELSWETQVYILMKRLHTGWRDAMDMPRAERLAYVKYELDVIKQEKEQAEKAKNKG